MTLLLVVVVESVLFAVFLIMNLQIGMAQRKIMDVDLADIKLVVLHLNIIVRKYKLKIYPLVSALY